MSRWEEIDRMGFIVKGLDSPSKTERVYTSYALTGKGREEIECYSALQYAVLDTLENWPESDEGDIVIEDNHSQSVVHFARSAGDPLIVHVYFITDNEYRLDHSESYRCEYETENGKVTTNIKRIA
jgi:hypothetical protein